MISNKALRIISRVLIAMVVMVELTRLYEQQSIEKLKEIYDRLQSMLLDYGVTVMDNRKVCV